MTYSTAKGYTVWYFAVLNARISVDGKRSSGWVHKSQNGLDILITRNDGEDPETYVVLLTTGHVAPRCPTAPRFPVFAESDLIPPCCVAVEGDFGAPVWHPPDRKLTVTSRSAAFVANDGKRVGLVVKSAAGAWEGIAKGSQMLELDAVAHSPIAGVITILLAPLGIAADRLYMAIRIRADPDRGLGRQDYQRSDAPLL